MPGGKYNHPLYQYIIITPSTPSNTCQSFITMDTIYTTQPSLPLEEEAGETPGFGQNLSASPDHKVPQTRRLGYLGN